MTRPRIDIPMFNMISLQSVGKSLRMRLRICTHEDLVLSEARLIFYFSYLMEKIII
jgi:hypothetical protein